jgi:uncharacterized repeat protein (TIGR03803 family)
MQKHQVNQTLVVLVSLLLAWPTVALAQFTFSTNSDGTLTVTGYSGTNANIVIPGMTNGMLVTEIGSNAFYDVGVTITVPNSVTNLADSAFSGIFPEAGLTSLTAVYFEGDTPAGTAAFHWVWPLTIYYLPGTTGWGTNFDGLPTRIWYPGELQLFLSPTGAVTDGAHWQVDGGPWLTNGASASNLAYGNHTVSYGPAKGWVPPPDLTMFVGTNYITTTNSAPYFALPGGPSQPTFQILHTFTGGDGSYPMSALTLVSNTLYGTTIYGGSSNAGTLFAINTDGSGFASLHSFTNGYGDSEAESSTTLLLHSNFLYGVEAGEMYRINPDGTGFTNLCEVGESDSGLIESSNVFYGTTVRGGSAGGGTVFAVNPDGSGFIVLHNFDASPNDEHFTIYAGLAVYSNMLYGGTFEGAPWSALYSLRTDGTGYTVWTNGGGCTSSFIACGNYLYGQEGGSIFLANPANQSVTFLTDGDSGGVPGAPLIVSGGTFYGTSFFGAYGQSYPTGNNGRIFAASTNGANFTGLYSFPNTSMGKYPAAPVTLVGTTLYGTAAHGGSNDNGTVFMLTFPPPTLNITPSDTNLVFTWPSGTVGAGYDAFSVQSTTNLSPPVIWSPVPVPLALVNNLNTVINPAPSVPTFYRLSQ